MSGDTCQWQQGRKCRGDLAWSSGPAPPLTRCARVCTCLSKYPYLLGRPSPISVETQRAHERDRRSFPQQTGTMVATHRYCVSLMNRSQQPDSDEVNGLDPSLSQRGTQQAAAQRTPKGTRLQGQRKSRAKTPRALRPLSATQAKRAAAVKASASTVIAREVRRGASRFPERVQTQRRGSAQAGVHLPGEL